MGILVITWNYPPRRGGIEHLVSHIVAGLRKRHGVRVVTAYHHSSEFTEMDVVRTPCPGLIPFALFVLWRGMLSLRGKPETSLVFGGSALVAPLVLILARLFGRRAVVQVHGLDIVYRSPLYQLMCVRWLKRCDRVIANSAYTATLAESRGVSPARISVIPPGVAPERFTAPVDVEATKRFYVLEGRQVILFVGRLARRKGVKEFIHESLPEIVAAVPQACFVIVGANPTESLTHRDDMVTEIAAAASRLGLERHVMLLGSLSDEDVVKLYQACDLVVLPALATPDDVEGFGIVLLEAAAAGKPVVATRVGGIPDAVEDGKSGILVEAGDYVALAQATVDLLSDKQKSVTMGTHARQRLLDHFTWGKTLPLYERALER
ncbi:MAG: glycosyltransferase family 4 protein [Deltaproteobacteria bacterium]|nr:glycosyltransferase family 4 protein [Deltaproteobacteria bacterium]